METTSHQVTLVERQLGQVDVIDVKICKVEVRPSHVGLKKRSLVMLGMQKENQVRLTRHVQG